MVERIKRYEDGLSGNVHVSELGARLDYTYVCGPLVLLDIPNQTTNAEGCLELAFYFFMLAQELTNHE